MDVAQLLDTLDGLAPWSLAEPWDRVGLQIGERTTAVGRVLVALEADDEALDVAAAAGCDVVLVHHPPLFAPLEGLTGDDPAGRLALRAARAGVAVIAAHTNLDKAQDGLAAIFAAMLDLELVRPLLPAAANALKLVGFVPLDQLAIVKTALFAAGAGVIGEYEHCSWSVSGEGSFKGSERSTPAVGSAGADEVVDEYRLEVVFAAALRRQVIAAFVAAHPYEEPAFDVYKVENEIASLGLGRLGDLPEARPLAAFAAEVARLLGQPSLRYVGDGARLVRRVACLPGAGGEAIAEGVAAVADVLLTGDVKYHQALAARQQGLALIDTPHDVCEQEALMRWSEQLAAALAGSGVGVETYRRSPVWQATSSPDATSTGASAAALGGSAGAHYLYTDGGARGNPGPAGIGAVLLSPAGDVVDELADFIGAATNNVAEYQALIAGLEMALDRDIRDLAVFLDSELVVRQVNGDYRVKEPTLKALHSEALHLLRQFREVGLSHVPRAQNAAADALVNQAIDAAQA